MKKALNVASNFLELLTIACFLALAALIFFQIGGRWLGLKGIGWTDEMVSCFTTWMVFLGLAYMCERDGHIRITMLQDVVPAWTRNAMMIVVRLANIVCGIAMTYSGFTWTRSTATKITPTLQIPYNIWYSSVWICGVIFTVFAIAKFIETIVAMTAKEPSPTISEAP